MQHDATLKNKKKQNKKFQLLIFDIMKWLKLVTRVEIRPILLLNEYNYSHVQFRYRKHRC
jgi:hypothetical protein